VANLHAVRHVLACDVYCKTLKGILNGRYQLLRDTGCHEVCSVQQGYITLPIDHRSISRSASCILVLGTTYVRRYIGMSSEVLKSRQIYRMTV